MIFCNKPVYLSFFLAIAVAAVPACKSDKSAEQHIEEQTNLPQTPWQKFVSKYDTLSRPFVLPAQDDSAHSHQLTAEEIQTFFNNATFRNMNDNDVADMQTNSEEATFHSVGRLTYPDYISLITLRQNAAEGNNVEMYYYLTNFTRDGKYLDGMCIAFTESLEGNKIKRSGTVADDGSIQLLQVENNNMKKRQFRAYQLEDNGSITLIDPNNTLKPSM